MQSLLNDNSLKHYTEFLRKTVGSVPNAVFDSKLSENSIVCKVCLGTGTLGRKKPCNNCGGSGERPMNNKWNLIMNIIDHKFRKLLFKPLCSL